MNENEELLSKCLDTINPSWHSAVVATLSENGLEYDVFQKKVDTEEMNVLLALVSSQTLNDLKSRME